MYCNSPPFQLLDCTADRHDVSWQVRLRHAPGCPCMPCSTSEATGHDDVNLHYRLQSRHAPDTQSTSRCPIKDRGWPVCCPGGEKCLSCFHRVQAPRNYLSCHSVQSLRSHDLVPSLILVFPPTPVLDHVNFHVLLRGACPPCCDWRRCIWLSFHSLESPLISRGKGSNILRSELQCLYDCSGSTPALHSQVYSKAGLNRRINLGRASKLVRISGARPMQ